MGYTKFISKQSGKPSGIFGRFLMSVFFERGNVELNSLVHNSLSITENEHILEIGFGPGALIKKIASCLNHGMIEGIDLSDSMVATARRKNRKYIQNGKVKIHLGDIEIVDFKDSNFDKIFSVNTIYFWKNPASIISKLCRILKPGGKLFIGFHDKVDMEKMSLDSNVFKYYSTQDLMEFLSIHGSLKNIEVISKKGKKGMYHCVFGTK